MGNATGHPSRIMDGSFANQVLAQMYLYELAWADQDPAQRSPITVEVLPKSLDEEVARYMVEGFGGTITQLTNKQADYIQVSVEAHLKPKPTSTDTLPARDIELGAILVPSSMTLSRRAHDGCGPSGSA